MKTRLDRWMVEHGLAASREKAQALIMAGEVRIGGQKASKPGQLVAEDARIEVLALTVVGFRHAVRFREAVHRRKGDLVLLRVLAGGFAEIFG